MFILLGLVVSSPFARAHIDSGAAAASRFLLPRNCFRHNCPDSIAAARVRHTSYGRAVIEIRCPPASRPPPAHTKSIVRGFCLAGFSLPKKEGLDRIPIQKLTWKLSYAAKYLRIL